MKNQMRSEKSTQGPFLLPPSFFSPRIALSFFVRTSRNSEAKKSQKQSGNFADASISNVTVACNGDRTRLRMDLGPGQQRSNALDLDPCPHPLRGQTLTVSYIGAPPFINYRTDPVSGVDILILDALAEQFGFDFRLRPEVEHGKTDANGTWHGMVESVSISPT